MAKDAAAKGQAKIDEVQAKKTADAMLRDLGAGFYATKTGRATPTTDAEIERLVAALQTTSPSTAPSRWRRSPPAAAPTASPTGDGAAAPAPPPPPKAADPASPPPPPPTGQTL